MSDILKLNIEILDALGLGPEHKVKSVTLHFSPDEFPTATVEEFIDPDRLKSAATVIKRCVLVPIKPDPAKPA